MGKLIRQMAKILHMVTVRVLGIGHGDKRAIVCGCVPVQYHSLILETQSSLCTRGRSHSVLGTHTIVVG